jgi:hypothetical protein
LKLSTLIKAILLEIYKPAKLTKEQEHKILTKRADKTHKTSSQTLKIRMIVENVLIVLAFQMTNSEQR